MTRRFVENHLGFTFTFGPADEDHDALCAERYATAHAALDAKFAAQNELAARFGVYDPTLDGLQFMPFELCAAEFEGAAVDGQYGYVIWFHASTPFDRAIAERLRKVIMAIFAQALLDFTPTFVSAELYVKYEETERMPFPVDSAN